MKKFITRIFSSLFIVIIFFVLPNYLSAHCPSDYGCWVDDQVWVKYLHITDGDVTLRYNDEIRFKIEVGYKKSSSKYQPTISKWTKVDIICSAYSNLVGIIDFDIQTQVKKDIRKGWNWYLTTTLDYPHLASLLRKQLDKEDEETWIKCRIKDTKKAKIALSYED